MDIAISTDSKTMYQVAKTSNDDNAILFFVHNIGSKESDLYGRYALILEDGVYLQDEDGCMMKSTINEAAAHISGDVEETKSILNNLFDAVVIDEDRQEDMACEILDQLKEDMSNGDYLSLMELIMSVPSKKLADRLNKS
ncbi:hypothetical protein LMH73_027700 [Vibrio splendidus]|nr:hypothetical protein [Vibrio splendidus]MCC4882463.1 hypothetical protein [Vibrio splendidus]